MYGRDEVKPEVRQQVVAPTQQANTGSAKPFDRSKLNPKAKPPTKLNVKGQEYTPTFMRLRMMAEQTYGYSPEEFKKLCVRTTGIEHSANYTWQDMWNIEDKITKEAKAMVPEVIDVEPQDETETDIEQGFERNNML